MEGLGDLPGGTFWSEAYGISTDGSVVVGRSASSSGQEEAFRWTEETGIKGLGDLPGGSFQSDARACSGDGSVIVGLSSSAAAPVVREAFIWDTANEMRSLRDVLSTEYGLNMTGWQLYEANDISPDGNVIVGRGYNPDGDFEGWIAVIPEPATFGILLMSGVFLFRRKH